MLKTLNKKLSSQKKIIETMYHNQLVKRSYNFLLQLIKKIGTLLLPKKRGFNSLPHGQIILMDIYFEKGIVISHYDTYIHFEIFCI